MLVLQERNALFMHSRMGADAIRGRRREMTLKESNQFFDTYDKVESRIREVAPLCTDICSCEEIMGFVLNCDNEICIMVRSRNYGNDVYYFPLEYLSMTDDEIAECEKKKAEDRREKERLERQERREYERLKKKYEGGTK